jgi:hypothetical protein
MNLEFFGAEECSATPHKRRKKKSATKEDILDDDLPTTIPNSAKEKTAKSGVIEDNADLATESGVPGDLLYAKPNYEMYIDSEEEVTKKASSLLDLDKKRDRKFKRKEIDEIEEVQIDNRPSAFKTKNKVQKQTSGRQTASRFHRDPALSGAKKSRDYINETLINKVEAEKVNKQAK